MNNVLLAGVTGYLGRYIAEELNARGFAIRAITHKLTLKEYFSELNAS